MKWPRRKAPADSNAFRAAWGPRTWSDMRLYPGRPDRQCAEVAKIVLLKVGGDPVTDLADGLWPHVIHGPKLDRRRAGQQELQGISRGHDSTDADNRNAQCSS